MPGQSMVAEPQINATPLIDVLLVLLVMLIFTIPVATHAVKLNLPQGPAGTPPPSVRVEIYSDGEMYWNDERVAVGRGSAASFRSDCKPGIASPRQDRAGQTRALRTRGAGAGGRATFARDRR